MGFNSGFKGLITLCYLLQDTNTRKFVLQPLFVEYPSFHHRTKAMTVASDISQFSVTWRKLISDCKQVEKPIYYRRVPMQLTEDNNCKSCGTFNILLPKIVLM